MRRILIFGLLFFISVVPNTSQTNDADCSALISATLASVGNTCGDMGINEACYGHNRVDAVFREENKDLVFNAPADRVKLSEVQSIATAPLRLDEQLWGVAVLNVQTNLGRTLPGQAVHFILMGNATLENDVQPDEALIWDEPISGIANANVNVRSQPTTNANIMAGLTAGDEAQVVGISEDGNWYEILLGDDRGTAWVSAGFIAIDPASSPPVTYRAGQLLYAPMQAFYFTTGIGSLECNQAPDAMIIQKPAGSIITLRVNDLNITLGSMLILTVTEVNNQQVLIITVIKGQIKAESETIDFLLKQAGDTVAITLNDEGRVDDDSRLLDAEDAGLDDVMQSMCTNASQTGLLEDLIPENCDLTLTPPESFGNASGGVCTITASSSVNLRDGPGTNYNLQGQLSTAQSAHPDGKSNGADGYLWWQLIGGAWVRSDLVTSSGNCDAVPFVDGPPPPQVQQPEVEVATVLGCDTRPHYNINDCSRHIPCEPPIMSEPILAGENVHFHFCHSLASSADFDISGESGSISVDGVTLSSYLTTDSCGFAVKSDAWIATSGTHTVSATLSTGETNTCAITIQ